MAEAIFAGEEVKEFSLQQRFAGFRFPDTKFPGFFKNLFVGYRPGNTSYRQSKQKQIGNLVNEQHKNGFVTN